MIKVQVDITGVGPYSQSKHYDTSEVPKLNEGEESNADYEKRTWRHRCHSDSEGNMIIPAPAFKLAMEAAASYKGIKIAGQGNKTWTKKFTSGIMQIEPLVLPVKVDKVPGEWLFVPSDGKRGGAKRVNRCFPFLSEWSGTTEFLVLDEIITEPVFEQFLTTAGQFIGVGRFRPERGGSYGRFVINKLRWNI